MKSENKKINKVINEVFGKTWDKLEGLINKIGYEEAFDNFVQYFDDDIVNKAIDSIAQNYDVIVDNEVDEDNDDNEELRNKEPFEYYGDGIGRTGLNEDDSSDNNNYKEIVGIDILNYFPFSELPEKREDANWRDGVKGWGKVYLPSIDTGDAQTQIVSKDDFVPTEFQGPKMVHKLPSYIDMFKKKFGEKPRFIIDPSQPWYAKVRIVNPEFLEWRKSSSDNKKDFLDLMDTTNESIRKVVRDSLNE